MARDQYAALLPVIERARGPEAPQTLDARGGLAWWTGEAGDAAAARDQYAALVLDIERVLGPQHPGIQHVREKLCYWTNQADGDVSPA